jgi:DNA replication and repair protein RecF
LQLRKLQLKNFRCFDQLSIDIDSPLILIEGNNGSGKTSILEALSYLCFLRSFRTHITKDLINDQKENFFIKAEFCNPDNNEIQVGFSNKKRLIKVNGSSVKTYKDLIESYRPITLIEDDLDLIKGSPEIRRIFIDQCILLNNPQILETFKKYKQVLERKNALLNKGSVKYEDYCLWTESLWKYGKIIQKVRIENLSLISIELNKIILQNFPELKVNFKYETKYNLQQEKFEEFLNLSPYLFNNEQLYKRSLFGTHLDDFSITFHDKKTKTFASRGQQKLVILLIKIAQIELLKSYGFSKSLVFLLDDFMTDFDYKYLQALIPLLYSLNIQLIFTCPTQESALKRLLIEKNALIVNLNI